MLSNLKLFYSGEIYSRVLTCMLLIVDILSFGWVTYIAEQLLIPAWLPAFHTFAFSSLLSWIIITAVLKLHTQEKIRKISAIALAQLQALPFLLMLQAIFLLAAYGTSTPQLITTLAFDVCALGMIVLIKTGLMLCYKLLRQQHKNRYIIVGYSSDGIRLHHYLEKSKHFGYQFCGFFDDTDRHDNLQGTLSNLYDYCLHHEIDHIYYAIHDRPELMERISAFADDHFIHFGYVINAYPLQLHRASRRRMMQVIPLSGVPINPQTTSL